MGKNLWTSDDHWNHTNVIKYCGRPFLKEDGTPDVELMNETMIERWNSVVDRDDVVYHLGDVAMGPRHLLPPIVERLNGYKVLVKGNHDRSKTAMLEAGFDEVYENICTRIGSIGIYMHHQPEPADVWRNDADIMLCGHVHEKWRRKGPMINVGVDQWDFTPRTLEELLAAPEQGDWPTPEEMD